MVRGHIQHSPSYYAKALIEPLAEVGVIASAPLSKRGYNRGHKALVNHSLAYLEHYIV